MSAHKRFEALSITVFTATLAGALYVNNNIDLDAVFGHYASVVLVIVGLLSYDMIYKACLLGIEKVDALKKLYWGSMYLEGLWEYASFDGQDEFIGIWRIEQDAFTTKVVAFGLDAQLRRRSTVQSVSDLMGGDGVYEIINKRWDLEQGSRTQFSRTTFVPDKAVRHGVFSYPAVIRGETVIFGGKTDGIINYDLRMWRRDGFDSEDALIESIRQRQGGTKPALPHARQAWQAPRAALKTIDSAD
ncbi:MAG: hypothetical protein QM639_10705 [Rhodocyclaceae bacterium]